MLSTMSLPCWGYKRLMNPKFAWKTDDPVINILLGKSRYWLNYWHTLGNEVTSGFTSNTLSLSNHWPFCSGLNTHCICYIIRPYGYFRPYDLALWYWIFGPPVCIYLAFQLQHSDPASLQGDNFFVELDF